MDDATAPTPEPAPDTTALDVQATLAFFLEVDLLKSVERRNWLADGSRRENTAEHSWHLGIAAMIMTPFATEPIDVGTAVCMALVHDIVEIDAGDTFAYDQSEHNDTKEAREQAAADRLFGMLPPAMGARFRQLWDEYERGDTPEARYVMAVDRMAPMLLNLAEGGSTWREHLITRQRVIDRNGPHVQPALPAVWAAALARLDALTAVGEVLDDRLAGPGTDDPEEPENDGFEDDDDGFGGMRQRTFVPTPEGFTVNLDRDEVNLLLRLFGEVRSLIMADDPNTAHLMRRLFPPAYHLADDAEAEAEYQRLMRDELVASRLEAISHVQGALVAGSPLSEAGMNGLMQALNSIRVVLGTLLDVSEEDEPGLLADDHPMLGEHHLYHFLSYLLQDAVTALSGPET